MMAEARGKFASWAARVNELKKIPLDEHAEHCYQTGWHVYQDEVEGDWKTLLTYTCVASNSNSFHSLYLLEKDTEPATYGVWSREGRIGQTGTTKFYDCNNLEYGKLAFCTEFYEKTGNLWCERKNFKKLEGYHRMVRVEGTPENVRKIGGLSLDPQVKKLLAFICQIAQQIGNDLAKDNKFDLKAMPFGQLSKEHIRDGFTALRKIDMMLTMMKGEGIALDMFRDELENACSNFYNVIPHVFEDKPELIETREDIKKKLNLLQVIADLKDTISQLGPGIGNLVNDEYYDNYQKLQCEIKALDPQSAEHATVMQYINTTRDHFAFNSIEIFILRKATEYQRFQDVGNRTLLWHGSGRNNFASILRLGLLVTPPAGTAYHGSAMGPGVYFSTRMSYSTQYSFIAGQGGVLLLCEVAVGTSTPQGNSTHLPPNYHSVGGGVNQAQAVTMPDGTIVPCGSNCVFVVGNTAQIRMRYLVKIT